MPTPEPTFPFNNTDLHNIYDAIYANGGGGGGELAGELLDGQVAPSNLSGFYPAKYISMNTSLSSIDASTASTEGTAIDIDNLLQNTKKFGVSSGRTLYSIANTGFATVALATANMVSAINSLNGPVYIVSMVINNNAGGLSGYNYSVLYYKA
jgi:hypothetical protein